MGRYQTYEWNRATRPKLNRTARKKLAQFLHETVSEKELQIPLPKKQPTKEPRFYEADDKPKAKRPQVPRTEGKPKLRKSITPGTVLILVAGPYRGKRVVFLKQLPNGSLVVTVNGVPLRRVAQAYVIATSIKIDISGVKVDEVIAAFAKRRAEIRKEKLKNAKKTTKPEEFFAPAEEQKKKRTPDEQLKSLQTPVDAALIKAIGAVPHLTEYLKCKFSLSKGQYPHLLKF